MSSSKKKSLTIVNSRDFTQHSMDEQERKWALLEKEIVAIISCSPRKLSFEDLYILAQDLYVHNYPKILDNLKVVIEMHLHEQVELLLFIEKNVVEAVDDFWKEYYANVVTVKNIFLYFDRSPKFFKYHTVQGISLGLFSGIILKNGTVQKRVMDEIIERIQEERDLGVVKNDGLLKSVMEMFNTLLLYEEVFVARFLRATQQYYEAAGTETMKLVPVRAYLVHVNKCIEHEQERVKTYLNSSTENLLMEIVYEQLVEKHALEILQSGFSVLVDGNLHLQLNLMYRLFLKVSNGTHHLLKYFKDYIVNKGGVITDNNNDKNMIQELLEFKDNLDRIVTQCFGNSVEFHECVRFAFKEVVTGCNAKTARHLAKFLDSKLRGKDMNDDDLERTLTKSIHLFKLVQGKDVFEAFYKRLLAKRLLMGRSANCDAEHSMISKLKEECGAGFTSNIEGMFQDVNLSKTINMSFKQRLKSHEPQLCSEFSVNVLTSSFWPNYPSFNVNLPVELLTYQQKFQKFYIANHSGRKLLWQPCLGHCLIKAMFNCGYKELQASLFQTIVLLLFNTTATASFKEIQEATNLEPNELNKTIVSLTHGKAKVLRKTTKSRVNSDEDLYSVNANFTDKLFRVKVNHLQMQESPEEEKQTEKNVLVDRQLQIDAAIVRIMKNKKTVKHYVLLRELYKVLDIPVSQTDLKKRIELLIEREYLERDKDNKSNYIYIA